MLRVLSHFFVSFCSKPFVAAKCRVHHFKLVTIFRFTNYSLSAETNERTNIRPIGKFPSFYQCLTNTDTTHTHIKYARQNGCCGIQLIYFRPCKACRAQNHTFQLLFRLTFLTFIKKKTKKRTNDAKIIS